MISPVILFGRVASATRIGAKSSGARRGKLSNSIRDYFAMMLTIRRGGGGVLDCLLITR